MGNQVYCLMGPTASGKTALALDLVQNYPFEIISVDSAMIYKGMDIGSAKPTLLELQQAPHHLIDIIEPVDAYNVATFCQDAWSLCEDILSRNKIPLLVGGTMMYFNALQFGLSNIPPSDPNVRERLLEEAVIQGIEVLYEQLQQIDPVFAAKIQPQDKQRIVRGLEVFHLTHLPLSHFQHKKASNNPFSYVNWILMPNSRAWLHERIAARFYKMIQEGLIEEVQALLKHWPLTPNHPSMKCVGYRQVIEYLAEKYSKEELISKGIAATRQVAKRQMTWLRHWPEAMYYAAEQEDLYQAVEKQLQMG